MALLTVFLFLGAYSCPSNAAFLASRARAHAKVPLTPLTLVGNSSSNLVGSSSVNLQATNSSVNLVVNAQHRNEVHSQTNSTLNQSVSWGAGVIHFLFMVNDNLPFADKWRSFLQGAPQGSWKVLVHCKDPDGCHRNGVFYNNPGFIQVSTTPTYYCHDLVTAMWQLTARALELQAAAYGQREKFVFLSESTLAIKPFSEIHGTLLLDDSSDFCLFPSDQWGSASIDGSFVKLIKHHQWVTLSRPHAEIFVRDWISVNAQSEWRIWLKTGTWEGHNRYVYPQSFYYPAHANTCTDEWAFMATIFGALEPMSGARILPGFGGGHLDMNTQATQGRCRTWTYWDNTWDPAATAVASQIANDFYGSSMSCFPKCHARPAELYKVSSSSLHALRRSPFLFARKFSANIWMPDYDSIILGAR